MILFSCNRFKNHLVWEDVKYDKNLKNHHEFKDMNRGYYYNPFLGDTNRYKKTCNIYYAIIREKKKDMYATESDNYYCAAQIFHDTLFVSIGRNDGFTADGLKINIVQKKFSIYPYLISDNISDEKKETPSKVDGQHLVLNKPNYTIGDSIFGQFYLKMMYKPQDREFDRNVYWSGEFRCKID
ncbi:MAG: hypothetical protein ACM3PR_09120 [Bacteroidales bacterium]